MARPFVWTPAKEQVLTWSLRGGVTQAEMATRLAVTQRTIEGWTRRKTFRERLETVRKARIAAMDARLRAWTKRQAEAMRAEHEVLLAADLAAIRAKYGRWVKKE